MPGCCGTGTRDRSQIERRRPPRARSPPGCQEREHGMARLSAAAWPHDHHRMVGSGHLVQQPHAPAQVGRIWPEALDLEGEVADLATTDVDLVSEHPCSWWSLGRSREKGGKGRKRDAEGRLFERHCRRRHRMPRSGGGGQGADGGGGPLAVEAHRPKSPHGRAHHPRLLLPIINGIVW